jgi:hypothetical protein
VIEGLPSKREALSSNPSAAVGGGGTERESGKIAGCLLQDLTPIGWV